MDGYELPANPDHWDDGDKLTHTARLLRQAERERDEARRALGEVRRQAEANHDAYLEAEAERDAARAQVAALQDAIGTDDEIEAYLDNLPWTPDTTDHERTLVAGNIRTFHGWIKDRAGGDE